MKNNQNGFVTPNVPQFAEVQELKQDIKIQLPSVEQIKEKGLSQELVNKLRDPDTIFNSDIVVYCSSSLYPCSNDKYFKVHIEVPPKLWLSGSHRFIFVDHGSTCTSFTANSVKEAEDRLKEFEKKDWRVDFEGIWENGEGGTLTKQANTTVRRILKDAIRDHKEFGNRVDIDYQLNRSGQ